MVVRYTTKGKQVMNLDERNHDVQQAYEKSGDPYLTDEDRRLNEEYRDGFNAVRKVAEWLLAESRFETRVQTFMYNTAFECHVQTLAALRNEREASQGRAI